MPVYVTKERYYTDAEGIAAHRTGGKVEREHVYKEGDPEASFLLYGAGVEVSEEDARRMGILTDEAEAVATAPQREGHSADVQVMQAARAEAAEEEEQKAAEASEAKAVETAPADKAVSRDRTSRK